MVKPLSLPTLPCNSHLSGTHSAAQPCIVPQTRIKMSFRDFSVVILTALLSMLQNQTFSVVPLLLTTF